MVWSVMLLSLLALPAAAILADDPRDGKARTDAHGDPLPAGAVARLGSLKFVNPSGTFATDGRTLALPGADGVVLLVDAATGRERLRIRHGVPGSLTSVALSADGKTLATGDSSRGIFLWDPQTGKQRGRLEGPREGITCLRFSADGRLLASASHDSIVRLWDLAAGKERRRFEAKGVGCIALSRDGGTLAAAGRLDPSEPGGHEPQSVRVWRTADGKPLPTLTGHRGFVCSVAFSPDGKVLVAAGCYDEDLNVWEVETGNKRPPFRGHFMPGLRVEFSPDGQTLAST